MEVVKISEKLTGFNNELSKGYFIYLGNKSNQEYSLFAFAREGYDLGVKLKADMKACLATKPIDKGTCEDLLTRYESFCNLVRKVHAVSLQFTKNLETLKEEDKTTMGSARVMNRKDAVEMTTFLEAFVTKVVTDFLTRGAVIPLTGTRTSTYMIDRADDIGQALGRMIDKEKPFKL